MDLVRFLATTLRGLLLVAALGTLVSAQERWSVELEPYVWIPELSGEGSADGSPDVDFTIDYPGGLSAALPLAVRIDAPGRSSVLVDVLYARWNDDEGAARTETSLSLLQLGWGTALGSDVALTAGLRAVELELEVELGGTAADASEAWVDPWLGARAARPLGAGWELAASGDVGGFGVGSELTWQALAYLGWRAGRWRIDFGWRALAVRFDEDDLATDLLASGPILGVGFAF